MVVRVLRVRLGVGNVACGGQAEGSKEDVADLAGHVEGREQRSECAHVERELRDGPVVGGVEDGVLRPEAGEEEGEAAEGEHADGVDREGDGHVLAQAAHTANVLLTGTAVDDGACAEEEQGLEEGVGDEVEHADGWAADSETHHHVAELGDGGVGEDALDVPLGDGDGGAEEGGDGADPGDDLEGGGGATACGHQRVDAGNEEDAGGDHGGGVDERADGGGAFHGVGQPDVEGDLAGFAGRSAEDEDADGGGGGEAEECGVRGKLR